MKIVKPSVEVYFHYPHKAGGGVIQPQVFLELVGRTCYRSADKITEESAPKFIKMLNDRGHHAMLEHCVASVKFITDRGISHELVRHRLASFAQESTRYVTSADKVKFTVSTMEDAFDLYETGLSIKRISDISNHKFTEWEIYKALKKVSIPIRPKGNHGIRNQDVFEIIDTPEKAYLIGLMLADGSVRTNGPQISITQKKSNSWYIKHMVETLLGGPVGLSNDKDCHQILFSGKKLWEDIQDKGVVPDKTHKMCSADRDRLEKAIPKALTPDFLRGIMDGDGCVRFYKQRGERSIKGSAQLIFTGQKPSMEYVSSVLQYCIPNYSHRIAPISGTPYLYRVAVTDKIRAVELCKLMYRNFIVPYGHPVKTSRVFSEITELPIKFAEWGDKKFQVILPGLTSPMSPALWLWMEAMIELEKAYVNMLHLGCQPQIARAVLPNSLKTEIWTTANLREWAHIFTLRCSPQAHPQIREVMLMALEQFAKEVPEMFSEIWKKYKPATS